MDVERGLSAIRERTQGTMRFIAVDGGEPRPARFATSVGSVMRAFACIG